MPTGKGLARGSQSGAIDARPVAKKASEKNARASARRQPDDVTPGEILREEFLLPMQISAYRLAKSIGVDQAAIGEILAGKRAITAGMALRFARYFGTTPDLWLNLQKNYELRLAQRDLADRIAQIRPFHRPA